MKCDWPMVIRGTGSAAPEQILTNDDIAKRVETNDEWIVQRTGIRQRRIASDEDSTLSLAVSASREALDHAGLTPDDIDQIVFATVTPDRTIPATACELQAELGCGLIPAFDIQAACSGFVYGLVNAAQSLQCGFAKTVLVVGSETLSRVTDQEDRATCILFGDGAGAAVIQRPDDPKQGILTAELGADGQRAKHIWIPAGGSAEPTSQRTLNERLHYMKMEGREVYKFAVSKIQELVTRSLDEAGVGIADLRLFIPHQSNIRIIESVSDKLHLSREQVVINIERYGNTSSASVPLAFHEAWQAGRIQRGDLVLMIGIGAGLTWGSVLLRV